MILSKGEIMRAIEQGSIGIAPAPEARQYSASSLDLRLGDKFFRWSQERMDSMTKAGFDNTVDPSQMSYTTLAELFLVPAEVDREGCYVIRSWDFVLGITHEKVDLPLEHGIAARVEGRSSLARMGLAVHVTAPTIQAGWSGYITLEIVNLGPWPIKLRPQELLACQLIFERVGEPDDSAEPSQFQEQVSPAG